MEKKSQKPTTALKNELMREMLHFMINASMKRPDILRYFADKWQADGHFSWGPNTSDEAKDSTIDNYITRVKDTYFRIDKEETEIERARMAARMDDLYGKCIKIQDYRTALAIIREHSELLGLKAPQRAEMIGIGSLLSEMKMQIEVIDGEQVVSLDEYKENINIA